MSANPFDYLNAITQNKKNLIADSDNPEQAERDYNPFMVNRGLSYYPDTLMYANEMNMLSHLDKRLQFEYLISSIKPAKRFSKWAKKTEDENVQLVMEYFGYSQKKAIEALRVLTPSDLETIKTKMTKGGSK